jgi:hypothetical protein
MPAAPNPAWMRFRVGFGVGGDYLLVVLLAMSTEEKEGLDS